MAEKNLSVQIESFKGNTSKGDVTLKAWQKPERLKRSLKMLGMAWGLAFVSIFLPVAHFILVPLFFIGGPVMFFITMKQQEVVLGGKGDCPDCHKTFDIVKSAARWPLEDMCNHCRSPVKISMTQGSPD